MTYSYELSQYLACPHRYQYRYLDSWKEKDTRAAMLFGREIFCSLPLSSTLKPSRRGGTGLPCLSVDHYVHKHEARVDADGWRRDVGGSGVRLIPPSEKKRQSAGWHIKRS